MCAPDEITPPPAQITRRDFLNGVAVTVGSAGLLGGRALADAQTSSTAAADYYPPALTGLRGSHPGSFEVAHMLRDGALARLPDVTPEPDTYDLVVCIEVVEHMPAADADAAIANICRHTGDVLFSSSPSDLTEATHLNVRSPEHWAERFARGGLLRDLDFDASFITSWAARFTRRDVPLPRLVLEYERAFARADLERRELRAQVLRWDRDAEEMPRLREQLSTAQSDLAVLRDRVFHMERSRVWRLRSVWTSLVDLLPGRRRADT